MKINWTKMSAGDYRFEYNGKVIAQILKADSGPLAWRWKLLPTGAWGRGDIMAHAQWAAEVEIRKYLGDVPDKDGPLVVRWRKESQTWYTAVVGDCAIASVMCGYNPPDWEWTLRWAGNVKGRTTTVGQGKAVVEARIKADEAKVKQYIKSR